MSNLDEFDMEAERNRLKKEALDEILSESLATLRMIANDPKMAPGVRRQACHDIVRIVREESKKTGSINPARLRMQAKNNQIWDDIPSL